MQISDHKHQRKLAKNLALTFLSKPDKLPKLTGKTGHIIWGMVEWKNSLYVLFVIRIYVSKTGLPGDSPTTFSLALPWVAFVFQTNFSQSGLNAIAQNGAVLILKAVNVRGKNTGILGDRSYFPVIFFLFFFFKRKKWLDISSTCSRNSAVTTVLQATIAFHCYCVLIFMLLNKFYWTKFWLWCAVKNRIWGTSRGCLLRIKVIRKGVREKAVASIWVVVYVAVQSLC